MNPDNELYDIPFTKGRYQITKSGKVWNVKTEKWKKISEHFYSKAFKEYSTSNTYRIVVLSVPGCKARKYYMHRLLAEVFLKKPSGFNLCVNHKNGIKSDNRLINLEWVTKKEDVKHAFKSRLTKISKPVYQIQNNKIIFEFETLYKAGASMGNREWYRKLIRRACDTGESFLGFHWKYKYPPMEIKPYHWRNISLKKYA